MNKEHWKFIEFEQCINKVVYTKKIQSSEYLLKGKYPIVSQEDVLISGYWNNKEDLFSINKPVVIFGDHTRNIKYIDFDFVLGADGVKVLEPKDNLNSKFLYYFLIWFNVPCLGYSRHYKLLKELSIPIPPLPVQSAIVADLDGLHHLKELQEKQLEEYDKLAQSTFYSMFGDPIDNEKGWEVKRLGEVAPVKKFKGQIEKTNNKFWLLNLDAVEQQSGNIIFYNYVDDSEITQSTATFNQENVLYSKLRPYLNKVVIPYKSGYCTSELLPLLPNKDLLNRLFLTLLLRNKSFVDFIQEKTNGAKMPRVSMDDFRNFNLIIPPLSLQNQFAERIEKIEAQKELVKQSIKETEQLIGYTMDKYFG